MSISTETRLRSLPFAVESELKEAAFNHGYQREAGAADGWLWFRSDTAPGEIALGASETFWFLALTHLGVAAELSGTTAYPFPAGSAVALAYSSQADMRAALSTAWRLARSLPSAPLNRFHEEVRGIGTTEAERMVRQRVGQDVFRAALIDYWGGCCPVTGIQDLALLRASHIVPWAKCDSDFERLNVHNGLLLSSLWDAAFDDGLVSFDDDGCALISPRLSAAARAALGAERAAPLRLKPDHRQRLAWHRQEVFQRT